MKLYHYWRSSCSYRVRIALNLKQLDYTPIAVNLLQQEEQAAQYAELNPQQAVPTLLTPTGLLTQSLAIIEYLEDRYPQPALLPADLEQRAQARAYAYAIACEVQPVNNTTPTKYLKTHFNASATDVESWMQHWMLKTFAALETMLPKTCGRYAVGDVPSIADLCLVPQIYNAHRFNVNMEEFPVINRINNNCLELPAFAKAHPDNFI